VVPEQEELADSSGGNGVICVKCGEENPYGRKICWNCNGMMVNFSIEHENREIDIKEVCTRGDPFKIKSKKFNYSFPYMTGNFSCLVTLIEGILDGNVPQESLKKHLDEIETRAKHYLEEILPGIKRKFDLPAVKDYRHILEKASKLTEKGFLKFLEAVEECRVVFTDGQNYHLEKGIAICYKANNLVGLGCVLAEKFHKGEGLSHIEAEIEEYINSEHISLYDD
jgi:hypothetical protein